VAQCKQARHELQPLVAVRAVEAPRHRLVPGGIRVARVGEVKPHRRHPITAGGGEFLELSVGLDRDITFHRVILSPRKTHRRRPVWST
jgi:hypothetical protein